MQIGFIGLGSMGKGMALRLLQRVSDMIVYDISDAAYPELIAQGAKTAQTPVDVAYVDVVFLSLPNGKIVTATIEKMLDTLHAGQIIVDLSTISYSSTVQIAELLAGRGVAFLDAPVSGMQARAEDGTLTVMCGGDEQTFASVKPYLDAIGNKVLYMGKTGSGQLAKLINQLLFDMNAAAIAEILPMSVKMGLDSERICDVVNSGTGRSYASEFFLPRDLEGNFADGYPMENAYKDLVSATEICAAEGIPTPVLDAAITTYRMALRKGLGRESKGAMIKVYEDMLGVTFRKKT